MLPCWQAPRPSPSLPPGNASAGPVRRMRRAGTRFNPVDARGPPKLTPPQPPHHSPSFFWGVYPDIWHFQLDQGRGCGQGSRWLWFCRAPPSRASSMCGAGGVRGGSWHTPCLSFPTCSPWLTDCSREGALSSPSPKSSPRSRMGVGCIRDPGCSQHRGPPPH